MKKIYWVVGITVGIIAINFVGCEMKRTNSIKVENKGNGIMVSTQ